ncbi:hypothetical protein BKA93DRAFT_863430 [Sparassis latifolia]
MYPSPTSGEAPGPPPYNEPRSCNSEKLKESFSLIVHNQLDIQRLFRSVAGQLENTNQIGEDHPLCNEWNGLRQTHRKLYRDSQQNAAQCASFLNNYAVILIPLSRSSMSLREKRFMIEKFLEAIPAHLNSAKKITERFHELGKEVEGFQLKVASALRTKAESSGFFENLWTGLEELCMSIWQALRKLLVQIVDTFRAMLSHIQTVRFSCVGIRIDIEMRRYTPLTSYTPQPSSRTVARQVKEDCKEISDNLSVFEDAWHVVGLSCSELLFSVAMAKSLAPIPVACDRNLKSVEATYLPLVECLRAYSTGQPPEF